MAEAAKKETEPQEEILAGFDFKQTHIFDPKTKRQVGKNPYRMFAMENVGKLVEWPVGSGNVWYENRKHAGRIKFDSDSGAMTFDKGADHVEYVAPLTMDEQLARDVATTQQENERLKAELAAIKAEQSKKIKPAPGQSTGKA